MTPLSSRLPMSSLFGDQRNPANRAALAAFLVLIDEAEATNAAYDATTATLMLARSVVSVSYKQAYRDRAVARGATSKPAMRGNGDWLQRQLELLTIDNPLDSARPILSVERLDALFAANGMSQHLKWNRTTPGWQGRLRMSGSLVLRTIVARQGYLTLANGGHVEAPLSFIDAHL